MKFVTTYGARPQHLLGTIGLCSFGVGALTMVWMAARWVLARIPALGLDEYMLSGRPAVVYSAALALFGAQLLSLGFLSELLVAETNRRAREYSIKEEIKAPQEDAKE